MIWQHGPRSTSLCKRCAALPNEQLYLENLPTQDLYEVSYNHRDTVTHIVATKYAPSPPGLEVT